LKQDCTYISVKEKEKEREMVLHGKILVNMALLLPILWPRIIYTRVLIIVHSPGLWL
jgi:hypothetical protein